jgi:hypothetical protein
LYQNELNDQKRALEYYEKFLDLLPKKTDRSVSSEGQMTITLRSIAESNIIKLKEELFFDGQLK